VGQRVEVNDPDLFSWVSRAELGHYTQNQLLRDTDVMSMAHSLEVRVPLLDHRLVELVLQLPTAYKLNGGSPKPLLRQAAGDLLPELVSQRRDKQGFTFPFTRWLRGPLRPLLAQYGGGMAGWLDRAAVTAVYRGFERGRVHWSRAWALVVLNGWLERQGTA
jgi:asparagine synthase (glutamine-hydrolysing)